MELKVAQHLAVLTNRFKGTGGIMNRHFIETLDSLYGPGFVRRNLQHIVEAVRSATLGRSVGPDSVLAVSFLHQHLHQPLGFNSVAAFSYNGSRADRAVVCTNGTWGAHRIGVLFLANGGTYVPEYRMPSWHLQTAQDWAWAHDQILEQGSDFLYGPGWEAAPPPSRRTTIAAPA